ncbi:MAG TPA: hypothetical protein VMV69_20375 [Pirellulales bacterium]|nr:hypothetical protein [Pirellulales bacterium]
MIVKVTELPDNDKRWLEGLLGQSLECGQQVAIVVIKPDVVPDEATRRRAAAAINQVIAKAERNANAQGVSDEEIDAAIEEAMRHVRPRGR